MNYNKKWSLTKIADSLPADTGYLIQKEIDCNPKFFFHCGHKDFNFYCILSNVATSDMNFKPQPINIEWFLSETKNSESENSENNNSETKIHGN